MSGSQPAFKAAALSLQIDQLTEKVSGFKQGTPVSAGALNTHTKALNQLLRGVTSSK